MTTAPARDIHGWFGLTNANYLVLNRTLLQSMPEEILTERVGSTPCVGCST